MTKKQIVILVAAGLVLAGIFFVRGQLADLKVNVPEYQRPAEVVWLQQNWSDAQRSRFHYTPQGTRLVPYEWFKALEQPCFSPFGCGMFADPGYLDRFGFVPGKADPELNPDGLPVGFAIDKDFVDPGTGKGYAVVGLTCAACHTNELFYDRYTVRIDGAPAMIEVTEFQKALGLAMAFNTTFPLSLGRYGRFERRVLGPDATAEQKAALKAEFEAFMAPGLQEKKDTTDLHVYDNLAGFARTDALTRIGNQVFAVDARIKANYAVANAPVRFPPIWDASWFDWVQYNSSIADPLVRNIGEALGVRAALKLYGAEASRFENSVNVQGLKTVEDLLSGPAQFQGLSSPKWPSVFPALDQQKVSRGAELYKQHCQRCHLPPVRDLLADLKGYGDEKRPPRYWWKNSLGNWYLKVTTVPIDDIGTDPHEARDFKDRKAETGDLKMGTKTASEGLALVTGAIRTNFFDRKNFLPDQRALWAGGRDGKDAGVRDDLIYKARPLDGIWAAAPYLHNGSVPNLYLLLSPKSDRPSEFWLGSKRYDPGKVGYDTAQMRGGYLLDTSKPGNSNAGHEFKDGTPGKGVIGPLLPPDDRMAIIEYLKSL